LQLSEVSHLPPPPPHLLDPSQVYESLGDIHRFNGNFSGSIAEYQRSLELREVACEDYDRLLAQAHYSLAVAHVYLSGDIPADGSVAPLTPAAILSLKKTALLHYQRAKEVLMKSPPPTTTAAMVAMESSSSAAPSPSVASADSTSSSAAAPAAVPGPGKAPLTEEEERKELCDEISETITALQEEISSLETPNGSGSSSSSRPNPAAMLGASTTTVGFGQSSSSSSMPLLEVKRKAFSSSSQPAAAATEDSQKKPKI
jgi:hypothetical protein